MCVSRRDGRTTMAKAISLRRHHNEIRKHHLISLSEDTCRQMTGPKLRCKPVGGCRLNKKVLNFHIYCINPNTEDYISHHWSAGLMVIHWWQHVTHEPAFHIVATSWWSKQRCHVYIFIYNKASNVCLTLREAGKKNGKKKFFSMGTKIFFSK